MRRKTDRRTLYTQRVIKESFLDLIEHTSFDKINVTSICRKAEISRSTFYLHFNSVEDVLDHVIDDALLLTEDSSGTIIDMIDSINSGRLNNIEMLKNNDILLPPCQRIADSERYHTLFEDPLVSNAIIRRITQHEYGKVIPGLMIRGNLSEEDAEMMFRFILHGTFAVNSALGWKKDERWFHAHSLISRLVSEGIKKL